MNMVETIGALSLGVVLSLNNKQLILIVLGMIFTVVGYVIPSGYYISFKTYKYIRRVHLF
jgi:hypothetical protein